MKEIRTIDDFKKHINASLGRTVVFFWIDGHKDSRRDKVLFSEISQQEEFSKIKFYQMQINLSSQNVNLVQQLGWKEDKNCVVTFMNGRKMQTLTVESFDFLFNGLKLRKISSVADYQSNVLDNPGISVVYLWSNPDVTEDRTLAELCQKKDFLPMRFYEVSVDVLQQGGIDFFSDFSEEENWLCLFYNGQYIGRMDASDDSKLLYRFFPRKNMVRSITTKAFFNNVGKQPMSAVLFCDPKKEKDASILNLLTVYMRLFPSVKFFAVDENKAGNGILIHQQNVKETPAILLFKEAAKIAVKTDQFSADQIIEFINTTFAEEAKKKA